MAGPWQTHPHGFGVYPGYFTGAQNVPPFAPTAGFYGNVMPFQPPILDGIHSNLVDFDDVNRPLLAAHNSARIRRRVNAGGEHVKFRRTRSGCYTCRNRRVKCDEARPTCEREWLSSDLSVKLMKQGCRKGNRECVYPEPPTATKARRDSNKSKSRDGEEDASSLDELDLEDLIAEDDDELASGLEEPNSATSADGPNLGARASTDPPYVHIPSPPSSSEAVSPLARAQTSTPISISGRKNATRRSEHRLHELPEDIRYYLRYASTKMSHHHWGVRIDHQNFFLRTMIELGLRYDPLLYALVGFAAYHCTIEKPDGKLGDFLGYYQKSIKLLRHTFHRKPTIATILTILQLATIEEYLGDWVNLMNHQKAALALITTLYTPEKMCTHESFRKVLQWYARFDVFVGILSGRATQMDRDWFVKQADFYKKQCEEDPNNLAWVYEERYAWARLTGYDLRDLMRRKSMNEISDEDFQEQLDVLDKLVENIYTDINPLLTEDTKRIVDISDGRERDPDDIVDPFEPGVLFGGDLYDTNMVIHDMMGFELLYRNLVGTVTGKFDNSAIRQVCLRQCQLYEAATLYSGSPPGIRFSMQAGLALSILFLRANEKEIWWARKAFAAIETEGYTYPIGLRKRLEALWGLDVSHWWLPGDQPRLVKQIREFVQSKPSDDTEANLYELNGIFTSLHLDSPSSPDVSAASPSSLNRPSLLRHASARSSTAMSSYSDDAHFDLDVMATHDGLGQSFNAQ